MAALSPETWAAVRGEWEVGATSTNALAQKYGVSEKAIRKRAIAELWQRDPGALIAAQNAGVMRGIVTHDQAKRPAKQPRAPIVPPPRIDGPVRGSEPLRSESSDPHPPQPESGPSSLDLAQRTARETVADDVRDRAVDYVAEIMAKGTVRDLERIDRMSETFDALHRHVMEILEGPGPDVDPQDRELMEAIAGSRDTIAAKVTAMAKLSESIQAQRRRAVGMDDRPRQVELSGPNGAPIQQVVREEKALVIDFAKLSTAQLEAYHDLALQLEGNTERPPVPAPPGDPGAIEGDEDAAAPA